MLSDLLLLAKESTPEARRRLLQRVADVFLDGIGGHTQTELQLFCDIILRLLDTTDLEDRAELSRRIAPVSDTPQPLAFRLAKDDIAVAAPVLEFSPSLDEEHLMLLARRMPQAHLEAMARRAGLSHRVSDFLIERGRMPVWRAVAANQRISMSDWALRTLTKRALSDMVLRDSMTNRHDLTPTICQWLIPHVDEPTRLRLQLILLGSDPQDTVDLRTVRRDLRQRSGISVETCDVNRLWALVENGACTLSEILLVLVDEKRLSDSVALLSRAASQPLAKVQFAIFQGGIDELFRLATSAGLTEQALVAIAKIRCRHLRIPEEQALRWLEAFRTTKSVGQQRAHQEDRRAVL